MGTLTITNSAVSNIKLYVTDYNKQTDGTTSYKLHVEGATFKGTTFSQIDAIVNMKSCISTVLPYGPGLSLSGLSSGQGTKTGEVYTEIPIGVYNCTMELTGVNLNFDSYAEARSLLEYRPESGSTMSTLHVEALLQVNSSST